MTSWVQSKKLHSQVCENPSVDAGSRASMLRNPTQISPNSVPHAHVGCVHIVGRQNQRNGYECGLIRRQVATEAARRIPKLAYATFIREGAQRLVPPAPEAFSIRIIGPHSKHSNAFVTAFACRRQALCRCLFFLLFISTHLGPKPHTCTVFSSARFLERVAKLQPVEIPHLEKKPPDSPFAPLFSR